MNDEPATSRELIVRSCPGDPLPPGLPGLIPGYALLECLGKGGMGAVYKARQLGLDRLVAVKLLNPELAQDREFVTRFLLEARTAGKLRHANIVSGLDCGVAGDVHFMAMEYVEGRSLDDLLRERGRLPEAEALRIVRQVADGLQHAWSHRIIHRDIKPQNIMVTPDGTAKICDLGLARSTKSDIHLTTTGYVHCTPTHSSPEQARGDKDVDCRADVYSLGITLYQLVTGVLPFKGASAASLIIAHATEAPVPPIQRQPRLSSGVDRLILHMIEKDRARRPETPGAVVFAIDGLLRGTPAASAPSTARSRTRRSVPPEPRVSLARPQRILLASAAAVAAILVFLALVRPGEDAPQPSKPELAGAAPPAAPARSRHPHADLIEDIERLEAGLVPPETVLARCEEAWPRLRESPYFDRLKAVRSKAELRKETRRSPEEDAKKLDAFLKEIEYVARIDGSFRRRAEVRSMWQSAMRQAGPRADEVRSRMEAYERSSDDAIRKAVDAARAETDPLRKLELSHKALLLAAGADQEAALKKELEDLKTSVRPAFEARLAELDADVKALVAEEKFGEALAAVTGSELRFLWFPEWRSEIAKRAGPIHLQSRSLYRALEASAVDARRRGDEKTVTEIRVRIAKWGLRVHADALEKALGAAR